MKIKFKTFEDVKKFNNYVTKMESDILVKSNHYVVDGKSLMGLYSLDLSKELDVDVESDNVEKNDLFNKLSILGIIV